ncbi:MAG: AMP-binding protein [Opitutales bacterium]
MGPTLSELPDLLKRPWLFDVEGPVDLRGALTQATQQIAEAREEGLGDGVLLCFEDRARFLAAWLAALMEEVPVFLADPKWGRRQWAEVEELLAPGLTLSDSPIPFHPPPGPERIGFNGCVGIPTGGTGGRVKFALHRWETLRASAEATARFFAQGQLHGHCLLPLHHVSGLMQAVRALTTGGELMLGDPVDPVASLTATTIPAGTLSLVPTQLTRLLQRPQAVPALRKCSLIFLGGGPASDTLLAQAREARLPLSPVYGMTETASMVAAQRPDAFLEKEGLTLEALPHAQIDVKNERVVVSAESLFLGYYPEMPRPRERFVTNDRGVLTTAGRLRLLGRADRILNSGGEKVDAARVEAAILEAKLAADCVVLGLADSEWGAVVAALLVAYPEAAAMDLSALREALSPHLAPAERPKHALWVDAIPRTAAGKPDWPAIERQFDRT